MKIKISPPDIPTAENPVIAVNIDLKRKKEHIIIGDFEAVSRYIRGQKKDGIFFDQTRKIGSLLLEITPRAGEFADLRVHLCDNLSKKPSVNLQIFEGLYTKNNAAVKFLTVKLWNEYTKALERLEKKEDIGDFVDIIEELTLPFRYNLMDEIFRWQRQFGINPLAVMPYEYFKHPVQTIIAVDNRKTSEYIVSDTNLLPVILHYLKTLYENKKYLNYCKVCGKLFLAPDVNKTTLCSEKCRKKQKQINKRKYDTENKEVDFERSYRNENMYWYNRVKKAQQKCNNRRILEKIEKLYDKHKKQAVNLKKAVKDSNMTYQEFDAWMLNERDVIDTVMEKAHLGKYE